jgi:hypothetical protein
MKINLTKDQVQKLALSLIGFVVLVYGYFNFFLGPLNRNRDSMLSSIGDLQGKVAGSKSEMAKTTNLEKEATTATTHYAALTALNPEGAPIAWFPPRMKAFFGNEQIDKVTTRLESNVPFKNADLSGWMQYNWILDLPQTDFSVLGRAIANLENTEPLLCIKHITIRGLSDDPQFQQVNLNVATTMLKR